MYLLSYDLVKSIQHGKRLLEIDAAASEGAQEAEPSTHRQRRELGGSLGKHGMLAPKTRYNV